jgi:uncharacterized protein (TIGR02118 family)
MIDIVFCLRRQPELSPEEFRRHWREQHAPLVKRHAEGLGIRRYAQLHSLDPSLSAVLRQGRGCMESDFDGVAVVSFDSLDALATAAGTPEGRRAGTDLLEDERRFIDLERSTIWFTEHHEVIG